MDRMNRAGAVVVTHSMAQVRQMCQAGAVLEDGDMSYYDDIEEAIAAHHRNMGIGEEE
jgi:capsular polysaccharide transport system ATP-binding protein